MKPTTRELLGFMFTNDARFRSDERSQLTAHILKYLRKENPRVMNKWRATVAGIVIAMVLLGAWLALDSNLDLNVFLAVFAIVGVACVFAIFRAGLKMFEAYFEVFPQDFPRKNK